MENNFILLAIGAFFAGMVDSVVGSGGLIMLPVLFSVFPTASPASLLATNKWIAVAGTLSAAIRYSRRLPIEWHALAPAAVAALVGGAFGAWAVTHTAPSLVRGMLPVILGLVFVYTVLKPGMGVSAPGRLQYPAMTGVLIGLLIGFYDGFFGPGTGTILAVLFVKCFRYDFLRATAAAKVINVITNTSAIAAFMWHVDVLWQYVPVLALLNIAGSVIGARLAMQRGATFIRQALLIVMGILIIRASYAVLFTA